MKTFDEELLKSEAKAEWDRKPDVRAEFGYDFESYLAYRVAVKLGVTKP